MGILSKGQFKLATRSDLVAKYLGQTAPKTQAVIDDARGNVLFLDEIYALSGGSDRNLDSFSKEAIDTLNQNLTERRDFLCIIAGYEDAVEKCFFAVNEGLRRRFTFRYNIDGYTSDELLEMFMLKVKLGGWDTEITPNDDDSYQTVIDKNKIKEKVVEFFKNNVSYFPNFGGDVETLFLNCKITHCRNIDFSTNTENNKTLTLKDIEEGFKMFTASRKYNHKDEYLPSMYLVD